jgi:hypothetical protein
VRRIFKEVIRTTQRDTNTGNMDENLVLRNEFVLVFNGDSLKIDQRGVRGLTAFQQQVPSIVSSMPLHTGVEVKMPAYASPGIHNINERKKVLEEYAANPMVLDVHVDSVEGTSCCCRHFMGFGFSKEIPYYFPGTIVTLPSTNSAGRRVTVTGMMAACGHRTREYGVLISFDQCIWMEEASALFPGFYLTEFEDDENACKAISELIWRYNCTMGDLEPSMLDTDVLQRFMIEKFGGDLLRLREALEIVLVSEELENCKGAAQAIEEDFHCYRSSLLLTMRCNPLGAREWLQKFEIYMACAAARRGLGFVEFILY